MASVVFLMIANMAAHKSHISADLLVATLGWTILVSALLHGALTLPLTSKYIHCLESASTDIPEFLEVAEPKNLCREAFHFSLIDYSE